MANKALLAANYSNALAGLLRSNSLPIQAIEFTPYTPLDEAKQVIPELKRFKFYYHPGGTIRFVNWHKQILQEQQNYCSVLNAPWISYHIVLKSALAVFLSQRGLRFKTKRKPKKEADFIKAIELLKNEFDCPIMLEHMPSSSPKDQLENQPEMITEIIRNTDTLFLLDIPHAIISASMCGIPVDIYLKALPLDRVKEIHISGPRYRGKYLIDAHETIRDEECYWLTWLLERTSPEVVTLEYFRDVKQLAKQLDKLAKILG